MENRVDVGRVTALVKDCNSFFVPVSWAGVDAQKIVAPLYDFFAGQNLSFGYAYERDSWELSMPDTSHDYTSDACIVVRNDTLAFVTDGEGRALVSFSPEGILVDVSASIVTRRSPGGDFANFPGIAYAGFCAQGFAPENPRAYPKNWTENRDKLVHGFSINREGGIFLIRKVDIQGENL